MAAKTDLWGDLAPLDVRPPVAILREQAALLGAKTKNLIRAKVETTVVRGDLSHSFDLVAPTLDNYTYELFRVYHGVRDLYPVKLLDDRKLSLKTEQELVDWLGAKLSSDETKKLIGNLLAQVTK